MTELFTRYGTAFAGSPQRDAKGKPYTTRRKVCSRCGGAGGAEQWRRTGWTCYQCGGDGAGGIETLKLYDAEQLARLNATAAKRAAKKLAAAEAAKAAADAEADARRESFLATHGLLLDSASRFAERSVFIADVLRKASERCELSEKQAAALASAIERISAEDAKRAASQFVGKVGERIELTVTAERVVSIETQFGTLRIATMRDADGNTIVAKGRFVPPTASWSEDHGWKVEPTPFSIKGTVKEHNVYRDEEQTIIQRVTLTKGKAT
jgi:ribosomal protein L37AE/L43A